MELPPIQQGSNQEQLYQKTMQKMFGQISNQLKYLFKNLNYIYNVHGISYNLANFHGYMLRILLPPELLSFIHFWCPNGKFKQQAQQMLDLSYTVKLDQKRTVGYIKSFEENEDEYQSLSHEQLAHKKANGKQEEQKIQQSYQLQAQQIRNQNSTTEGELKLYKWVIEHIQKGSIISRLDLIKQAIIEGEIEHLSGSSRWCRKFLTKFKQLKNYVKKDSPGMQRGNKQKISQLISELYKRKQLGSESGLNHPNISAKLQNFSYTEKNSELSYISDQYEQDSNENQEQPPRKQSKITNSSKPAKQPQYYEEKEEKRLYELCEEAEPKPIRTIPIQQIYHDKPVDIGEEYLQQLKKKYREMWKNQIYENEKKYFQKNKINITQMKQRHLEDSYKPPQSDSQLLNQSDWSEEFQQISYHGRSGKSEIKELSDNQEQIVEESDRIYVENRYLEKMSSNSK